MDKKRRKTNVSINWHSLDWTKPYRELAKLTGYNKDTLVKKRRALFPNERKTRKWLPEAKRLRAQGMSYPKMGKALGLSALTVYNGLNAERLGSKQNEVTKPYKPDGWWGAHAKELGRSSTEEFCRKHGVTYASVQSNRTRQGINTPREKDARFKRYGFDWKSLDWTKPYFELAKLTGYSIRYLYLKRSELFPNERKAPPKKRRT